MNRPTTAALAGHGKLGHELAAFGRETKIGFFNAFGYKFFAKKGTSSSTAPTVSTGMTEVKNLSNAGLSSTTDTQEVITYDTSTNGWKQQIVTANSYTISCELNIDTADAGYKLLKQAARDSATGVMIEWFRETPAPAVSGGGTSTAETHAGVAAVGNFSEDIQAGNVAKVTFDLVGYGPYVLTEATVTP